MLDLGSAHISTSTNRSSDPGDPGRPGDPGGPGGLALPVVLGLPGLLGLPDPPDDLICGVDVVLRSEAGSGRSQKVVSSSGPEHHQEA